MNTSHAVNREEVMAFLDGELTMSRAAEVEAHVNGCSECRTLVESLRQVSGTLNDWSVDSIPDDLRMRAGATTSWWKRRTRLGVPGWVLAALPTAAVLAMVMLWPTTGNLPRYAQDLPMAARTGDAPPPPSGPTVIGRPEASGGGRPGMSGGRGGESRGLQPLALSRLEPTTGPMIARSVSMSIVTEQFPEARGALERVTTDTGGMVSALKMTGDPPARRSLQATLRIPAAQLETALVEVRKIGQVRQESQSSEDIGDAHRDLVVRIDNGTKEEARLNDLLANRTGRLQDVLAVEQEVTRVRGQIEQMKAEALAMRNRVTYATITVDISEAYRAEASLGPQPIGSRLRNAVIDGWRAALSSVLEALLVVLQVGPAVLLWMLIFGTLPAFWLWRRARRT